MGMTPQPVVRRRPGRMEEERGVFMDFDFNKIKEMAWNTQKKVRTPPKTWPRRGKTQALIVNEQGKLLKAQRQLGALVYSLAKGKEENQPLVDKYIEMIDSIEGEIARLKASLTRRKPLRWNSPKPKSRLLKKLPLPRQRLPKSPARPARSAVHPSRTMHCSAISAAHSCNVNSAPAKTGKRAVSPLAGYRPVFAKKEKSP